MFDPKFFAGTDEHKAALIRQAVADLCVMLNHADRQGVRVDLELTFEKITAFGEGDSLIWKNKLTVFRVIRDQ